MKGLVPAGENKIAKILTGKVSIALFCCADHVIQGDIALELLLLHTFFTADYDSRTIRASSSCILSPRVT